MADVYKSGIEKFDEQLSFEPLKSFNLEGLKGFSPDGVVVSGMGGSGLPGKILKSFQNETGINLPILNWNSYGIPKHQFQKPLYVFLSHSGNTAEALSGMVEAENNSVYGVITSDERGHMGSIAEKNGLPLTVFPGNLTPRLSFGYMYYALIKTLSSVFPEIKTKEFSSKINPKELERQGSLLAKKLFKKTVLVYTYPEQSHLSYIWKINLNETAKQPSFWGVFPEVTHNEAISFTDNKDGFAIVFLKETTDDFKRENEKLKYFERFAEEKGVDVFAVEINGESAEEKTWKSIILSHWTSFYLAELNGVEASDTKDMAEIKKADKDFFAE